MTSIILFSIIILGLLLIYFIVLYHTKKKEHFALVNNFWDIRHKFKTGDIILFSFLADMRYIFRKYYLGTEYGHIGIIVKKMINYLLSNAWARLMIKI